jgi:hypothetical protein
MGWLFELLKDVPLSVVLRERVQLAEDKVKKLQMERDEARSEVERLTREIEAINKRFDEQKISEKEFVSFKGVKWKRKPSGELEQVPYCPSCSLVLHPVPQFGLLPRDFLKCYCCSFRSPFKLSELDRIATEAAEQRCPA